MTRFRLYLRRRRHIKVTIEISRNRAKAIIMYGPRLVICYTDDGFHLFNGIRDDSIGQRRSILANKYIQNPESSTSFWNALEKCCQFFGRQKTNDFLHTTGVKLRKSIIKCSAWTNVEVLCSHYALGQCYRIINYPREHGR